MKSEIATYQGFKEASKSTLLNKTRIAAGMLVGFGMYVHEATLYEGVSDNNWGALQGSGTLGIVCEGTGTTVILRDIVKKRKTQAILHIAAELKEQNERIQDFLDSLPAPQQVETNVITLQSDEYRVISNDSPQQDSGI